MRWAVLLAAIPLCLGCENQQVTHPFDFGTNGDGGEQPTDGGPSFGVRDAGPDAGGTTGSGSTTGGATGGSTGLTSNASNSGSTGTSGTTSTSGGTTGAVDAGPVDAGFVDLDGDGLDDGFEAAMARAYLPFISLHPQEACPLGGIVYTVSPHPDDATKLRIVYVHLYEQECPPIGASRVGDVEAFALTVDPSVPPPMGALYVKAVASENGCTHSSACTTHVASGACAGVAACDLGTVQGTTQRPVVYGSHGRHGSYTSLSECNAACGESCALSSAPSLPPMINIGEPGMPLVSDLTTHGFISFPNGWTQTSLQDYDPWGGAPFGTSGSVSDALNNPALATLVCP